MTIREEEKESFPGGEKELVKMPTAPGLWGRARQHHSSGRRLLCPGPSSPRIEEQEMGWLNTECALRYSYTSAYFDYDLGTYKLHLATVTLTFAVQLLPGLTGSTETVPNFPSSIDSLFSINDPRTQTTYVSDALGEAQLNSKHAKPCAVALGGIF